MNKLLKILGFMAIISPGVTQAICTNSIGIEPQTRFGPKFPIVLDTNVNVGEEIGRATFLPVSQTPDNIYTCDTELASNGILVSYYPRSTVGSDLNPVYQTSVPGVGVQLVTNIYGGGGGIDPLPYNYPPIRVGPFSGKSHKWSFPSTAGAISVRFIKTGPITSSNILSGHFAKWIEPANGGHVTMAFVFDQQIVIDPGAPTCTVTNFTSSVALGTASPSDFSGVGTSPAQPAQPININLNCVNGVGSFLRTVATTLTDQTDITNRGDYLKLAPDGGRSASGVGVQIRHQGNVVRFGPDSSAAFVENQWVAGAAGNGPFSIPLDARFVQTESTIIGGSANARMSFTMSYQ